MGLLGLCEADESSIFSEALSADTDTVLADQTLSVTANLASSSTLGVVLWVREPDIFVAHVVIVSLLEN